MKFIRLLSTLLIMGAATSPLTANASPKAPAFLLDAFPGWTHVTEALDATGDGIRIDIGGGNNDHADLSTFDPAVLRPGSVVNIWHRSTPYNTVHLFHKDGTEENPIIVNGVTDANGNRPIFDCTNPRVGIPAAFGASTLETYGFFILSYNRDGGTYNDPAEWNTFQNLHVRNCAASVRAQPARHLTIQHNVIDSNHNGVFLSDVAGGTWSTIVRGNHFTNNGTSGNYLEHSIYFQGLAVSPEYPNIIEGNLFDEMLPSAPGMQIKTRATDTIIRYNTVYCQRICFEIGELQGSLPEIVYSTFSEQEITDRVQTSYVYGNQFFINTANGSAVYPFHVGVDTGGSGSPSYVYNYGAANGRNMSRGIGDGMTYFYHNSVSIISDNYHQTLFGLGYKDIDAPDTFGSLTATNNVIRMQSSASGRLNHLRLGGNLTYSGVNQLNLLNHSATSPFPRKNSSSNPDDPDVVITGDSSPTLVITRDAAGDPLFTSATPSTGMEIDFTLTSGSPAIGAAARLPQTVIDNYPVLYQPVPPSQGGGVAPRRTIKNLGAIE